VITTRGGQNPPHAKPADALATAKRGINEFDPIAWSGTTRDWLMKIYDLL